LYRDEWIRDRKETLSHRVSISSRSMKGGHASAVHSYKSFVLNNFHETSSGNPRQCLIKFKFGIARDYLFAVLDPIREIWEDQRKVRPGNDVLLLIRSKNLKKWKIDVQRVAAGDFKCYSSETAFPMSYSEKLQGLPLGWCVLHFQLREELPADTPDWIFLIPCNP
jgi:hypothetical protein